MKTMKSKLQILAGTILLLVSLPVSSPAQALGGGPAMGVAAPQIDPQTGLPVSPSDNWKDPNWKDPDITLTNVIYDNVPLSEVANQLRDQFKEQFDVLLPGPPTTSSGRFVPGGQQYDWREEQIQLRLRNVTASEIFAAMNLVFENNHTPLRWELRTNGHRQLALLRALFEPASVGVGFQPPPEEQRRVYFVGDLVGDEKTGVGMSMEQIIKTIKEVSDMANLPGSNIYFHKEAQLLVVTGSPGQIDFMEQTLKALRTKVERQRAETMRAERHPPMPQPGPKPDASGPAGK